MVNCRFCKRSGHNITMCNSPLVNKTIENLQIELRNIDDHPHMLINLNHKPSEVLALFALSFGIKSSLPKSIHVEQIATIMMNRNRRSFQEMTNRIVLIRQRLATHPNNIGIDLERNSREIAMQIELVLQYFPNAYGSIERCIQAKMNQTTNLFRIAELRHAFHTGFQSAMRNIVEEEPQKRVWKINPIVVCCEYSSSTEEKECPICMNDFLKQDMVITGCNHMYCHDCMNHLIEKMTTFTKPPGCALCRSVIDSINVQKVDLYPEYAKYATV